MNIVCDDLNTKQNLKNKTLLWLMENSCSWNVCVALHVPNAMKRHFYGYTSDWLSKELKRYFNAVDRRIFKAAHKNRDKRLKRIVVLEHDELVGWHAHIMCDCADGMNEDETIDILKKFWEKQTDRFATGKFEKRLGYFEYDQGFYMRYILKKALSDEEGYTGLIDLKNTHLENN